MGVVRFFQDAQRARAACTKPDLVFLPQELIAQCKTYRDACRLAWEWRKVHNMTKLSLAEQCELLPCFVTDYFNEMPKDRKGRRRRELPAEKIDVVETVLGNNAITQFLVSRKGFRLWEEVLALKDRIAAA